ncbi:hypothetical protein LAY57_02315 [Argonema antarcticum A004/B2]|nr:hypothetical protein [Argonema antarcticum A004/B2]
MGVNKLNSQKPGFLEKPGFFGLEVLRLIMPTYLDRVLHNFDREKKT